MRLHQPIPCAPLPTVLRRRLEQPALAAEMFVATQWATAADKAAFARHFLRFVAQDMPANLFTKPFYFRLSLTFGHIAHCNRPGLFEHFFGSAVGKLRFLEQTLAWRPVGSPAWTFADVERALQSRLLELPLSTLYRSRLEAPCRAAPARPEQADLFGPL